MTDSDIAISVQGVHKTFKLPHEASGGIKNTLVNFYKRKRGYEIQHVLNGVSFDVRKGEFFGIVGRNGSGKSTLLKLLAGIYAPDKGHIQVNGSLTPFIELGVGFNPELTGRENIYMNGAMLGFSNAEMDSMYDEIVDFAEIERFMDQKLKNYSSGMQVRLAFSIAIRANMDILVLDEVLAVGDEAFQQKCFDYFTQLKREKKTVILVTHDMSAVNRFCNRAILLKNGEIMRVGRPKDIADTYKEENIIDHAMVGSKKANTILDLDITHSDSKSVSFKFTVKSDYLDEKYVALAVTKNGATIGEINSLHMPISGSDGEIIYELETKNLTPGPYELTGIVCRTDSREVLAISKKNIPFLVKGSDERRSGGMRLPDTWHKKGD